MEPVTRANAAHYTWGEVCDGWHFLRAPGLSVILERVPAGASEVRHYHERARQFFFVLEGEASLEIDGREVVLRREQGIEVAPRAPHRLWNASDADVVFLVVSSPPSHGDRIAAENA